MSTHSIWWIRRDIRLQDNTALYHALNAGDPVIPVFIFDKNILEDLPKDDKRVQFIHDRLRQLKAEIQALSSSLYIRYGKPEEIWPELIDKFDISAVYANHDYEPYATKRDEEVKKMLATHKIDFHTYKDQVIFEKKEILTGANKPYTVFTPYMNKWKETLTNADIQSHPSEKRLSRFWQSIALPIPTLRDMGFKGHLMEFPSTTPRPALIQEYDQKRDFPAIKGTTRLGVHLRFGTISIRKLIRETSKLNETYLNELIWREFYMQILWNFPQVVDTAFKPQYDRIPWRNNKEEFEKWCEGKTGYPIVDAGMRELNATGFMHNRARMITASFLTKHLLIDWRWGEAYFAEKLLDFELASNNGGWQWAASSGCDAAPYFRVFNPELQMKKFDQELKYVRKWVKEYDTPDYPAPIVEHKFARERVLATYKAALGQTDEPEVEEA